MTGISSFRVERWNLARLVKKLRNSGSVLELNQQSNIVVYAANTYSQVHRTHFDMLKELKGRGWVVFLQTLDQRRIHFEPGVLSAWERKHIDQIHKLVSSFDPARKILFVEPAEATEELKAIYYEFYLRGWRVIGV